MSWKPPNKQTFQELLKAVTESARDEGYIPHPIYPIGWEPSNQAYEATLIKQDLSDSIDQFQIAYYPTDRGVRFSVTRHTTLTHFKDLSDLPQAPHEWTDCWLYEPYTEYCLMSGRLWNPFYPRKTMFRAQYNTGDPAWAAGEVFARYQRNAPYLWDALRGGYAGPMVKVAQYHLKPPVAP